MAFIYEKLLKRSNNKISNQLPALQLQSVHLYINSFVPGTVHRSSCHELSQLTRAHEFNAKANRRQKGFETLILKESKVTAKIRCLEKFSRNSHPFIQYRGCNFLLLVFSSTKCIQLIKTVAKCIIL